MSTQETAAHSAVVIIDLENLGNRPSSARRRDYHYDDMKADSVLKLIDRISLMAYKEGFVVREGWVVARGVREYADAGGVTQVMGDPQTQQEVTRAMWTRGFFTSWSKSIADAAIISELTQRLAEKSLPQCVVLVSGDTDFVPVAKNVRDAGHRVILVPHDFPSSRWWPVAHRIVTLTELRLGQLTPA